MHITRRQALGAGLIAVGSTAAAVLTRGKPDEATASQIPFKTFQPTNSARDASSLDFWVAGDSGMATELRSACTGSLRTLQAANPAAFTILTGDNFYPNGVSSVDAPEWNEHVEETFGCLKIPIYPCLGNHDHAGSIAAQVNRTAVSNSWRLPAPYHSFTYGISGGAEAEFFVIDTQDIRLSMSLFSSQLAWIERALASSKARWKIVIGHHPLITGGTKQVSQKLAGLISETFHEHGVHFYLSGHCHTLELLDSGRGWAQVISGAFAAPQLATTQPSTRFAHSAGGYTRMSLQSDRAEIRFHDTGGRLLTALEWDRA